MNNLYFEICDRDPAALERALRVIRLRGFSLTDLQMQQRLQNKLVSVIITGERSIDNLVAQLNKLHSVAAVCCENRSEKKLCHQIG